MASNTNINTDKAIKNLTEQIAKLSINLAEKQNNPISKPTYYSNNELSRNRPNNNHNNNRFL